MSRKAAVRMAGQLLEGGQVAFEADDAEAGRCR
jgi:hypothetical protein